MNKNLAAIDAMLSLYLIDYIGKGNLDTTGEQVVSKLRRILAIFAEDYGVEFKEDSITGLSSRELMAWRRSMIASCRAASTRNNYINLLNPFLEWAVDNQFLRRKQNAADPDEKPIYKVLTNDKLPKEENIPEHLKKKKHFTPQEIETFMAEMPGRFLIRDRAIVALFLASGLRENELCSLTIGQVIGQEEGLIYLRRKGGAWKHTEVAPFFYPFLEEYLKTREDADDMSAPLFITMRKTPCNPRQIRKLIAEKEKKLGMQTGVHILRHSFVSNIEKNAGAGAARDLANHKSLAITSRYDHTSPQDRREAVGKLDWGALHPSSYR